MSAAIALEAGDDATWRVTLEGEHVALIAVRHEHGEVVVSTQPVSGSEQPFRFDTLQAADAFMSDLVTSFSYLGCDVDKTLEGVRPA